MMAMSMMMIVIAQNGYQGSHRNIDSHAAERSEHADRAGQYVAREDAETGAEHDQADDHVDPAPGRCIELCDVVGGDDQDLILEEPDEADERLEEPDCDQDDPGERHPSGPGVTLCF